jgi:hypothetical protein
MLSYGTSIIENVVKPGVKYLEILTLEGNELILSRCGALQRATEEAIRMWFKTHHIDLKMIKRSMHEY